MLLLGRVIRTIAGVIAAFIVAGILLVVLKANMGNAIVSDVHDVAKWFASPFDGMFNLDNHRTEIAVNWGIGAAVYLLVGGLLAGLCDRAAVASSTRVQRV